MSVTSRILGSACVPRAGERVLATANFSQHGEYMAKQCLSKDCFGATPKPARGTRALPRVRRPEAMRLIASILVGMPADRRR